MPMRFDGYPSSPVRQEENEKKTTATRTASWRRAMRRWRENKSGARPRCHDGCHLHSRRPAPNKKRAGQQFGRILVLLQYPWSLLFSSVSPQPRRSRAPDVFSRRRGYAERRRGALCQTVFFSQYRFFRIPRAIKGNHDTSTSNRRRRPSGSPLRVRRRLQRREAVVGRSRLLRDGPDDHDGTLPNPDGQGAGEDAGGAGLRSLRTLEGPGQGEAQGQRSDCRPGLHRGTDVARSLRHVRRYYQRIQ